MHFDDPRKERIYLTGFMGSGKSTIGPILANTIGYDFVDVDRMIEQRAGKSVNAIFKEDGEQRFRELERALLVDLSAKSHLVISLGGGTIADSANFQMISTSGIVVYLRATPEQIFKRMQRKTDRPILTDVNGDRLGEDELRARIHELYVKREPYYARADITIPTDERKVGITVDFIVKHLSFYID
jgi:shikimate kinase